MKLNHRLIASDNHIFRLKLRAMRKNLSQFCESAFYEVLLAEVVAGQRVRSHHCPIDRLRNMLEQSLPITFLQPFENFTNET